MVSFFCGDGWAVYGLFWVAIGSLGLFSAWNRVGISPRKPLGASVKTVLGFLDSGTGLVPSDISHSGFEISVPGDCKIAALGGILFGRLDTGDSVRSTV